MDLSQNAHIVLWSLKNHPELGTPDAIVSQRRWVQQVSKERVGVALRELEAAGLAREVGGWWELTAAGRAAAGAE